MTLDAIKKIVADIHAPGMDVHAVRCGNRLCLQGTLYDRGNVQWTRKWYVSKHATKNEVVNTVFKLSMTAAEHELRERFTYRGVNIYGPHLNVDKLVRFAERPDNLDVRPA